MTAKRDGFVQLVSFPRSLEASQLFYGVDNIVPVSYSAN